MSKVLTWRTALDNGFEPRDYAYAVEDLPIGDYEARLDCKIWQKNTMGISCYFTGLSDEKKFRLTVFLRKEDKVYALPDSTLDFRDCPLKRNYLLRVVINSEDNPVFKHAQLLD